MPQVVLYQPRIRALVGEGKAARTAQHVRVRFNGQVGEPAIGADRQPGGHTAERAAPLADKERVGIWLHCSTFCEPCLDSPELVTPEWVRGGQSLFEPCDMQHAAFDVHLGHPQPAGFRHAQTMPEHQGGA